MSPGSRPSSAFGYAQVTNPTWDWYKMRNGKKNASRSNFKDVTDFIGWYSDQTYKMLGISKNDFYNQYLAYHEGHGGWKNKSYLSKKWLPHLIFRWYGDSPPLHKTSKIDLNSNHINILRGPLNWNE